FEEADMSGFRLNALNRHIERLPVGRNHALAYSVVAAIHITRKASHSSGLKLSNLFLQCLN
ncbi:hypothetical protein, partial [Salmonella enterica]|uniref:hypothetical protein n=1 Tax=Salmonella enterica TaxID=28901 RepID=UPI001CB73564